MGKIIGTIILGIISLGCFVLGYRQLKEKGILLNNAFLFGTEENNKPYYRQSGTVFILLGVIFAINTIDIVLRTDWLFFLVILVDLITLIYAIVSSVKIRQKGKAHNHDAQDNEDDACCPIKRRRR